MTRRANPRDEIAAAKANPPQDIPAGPPIDRSLLMPGYRARHDGWSEARTQRFFDVLGHTGCVTDAARVAGMSVTGARRLRKQFPAFARAWDDALARAQQGLIAIAYKRAVEGKETVIIRKGKEVERRIAPSDSILGLLVKRGDAIGDDRVKAEDAITYAEHLDHWRFDRHGKKVQKDSPEVVAQRLEAKFAKMRERMEAEGAIDTRPVCHTCLQPWPRAPEHCPRSDLVTAGYATTVEVYGYDRGE